MSGQESMGNMEKIKPTKGKLLCELIKGEEVSKGGIILKKYLKEKPHKARVVATGPPEILTCSKCDEVKYCKEKTCEWKNKEIPMPAAHGDLVHFKQGAGVRLRYKEREYIILRTLEVLGKEG